MNQQEKFIKELREEALDVVSTLEKIQIIGQIPMIRSLASKMDVNK